MTDAELRAGEDAEQAVCQTHVDGRVRVARLGGPARERRGRRDCSCSSERPADSRSSPTKLRRSNLTSDFGRRGSTASSAQHVGAHRRPRRGDGGNRRRRARPVRAALLQGHRGSESNARPSRPQANAWSCPRAPPRRRSRPSSPFIRGRRSPAQRASRSSTRSPRRARSVRSRFAAALRPVIERCARGGRAARDLVVGWDRRRRVPRHDRRRDNARERLLQQRTSCVSP